MKSWRCHECDQAVFFHDLMCVNCSATLGFDPESMEMLSLRKKGGSDQTGRQVLVDHFGREFLQCHNGVQYGVCNWLIPVDNPHTFCKGCQLNRTIPNLDNPTNIIRWNNFEHAKKRLLFTLFRLEISISSGHSNPEKGLLFDLIEDHRTNFEDFSGSFVHTGHLDGLITINALEADDVQRAAVKQEMNETYRTLIGHLRHESGHFIWSFVKKNDQLMQEFEALFGDESIDYGSTMENYYKHGPADNWQKHYISPYASAHPAEDWAEVWGHYLFIYDAIETALSYGVIPPPQKKIGIQARILLWQKLSVVLNELNRSAGLDDAYPFVLNKTIRQKLEFVDKAVDYLRVGQ